MTTHEKLVNRIHEEQKQYLEEIEQLTPKEIISKAYEICYREEFICMLETTEYSEEIMTKLLQYQNPIAVLYREWLYMDGSVCDILEDVIRNI